MPGRVWAGCLWLRSGFGPACKRTLPAPKTAGSTICQRNASCWRASDDVTLTWSGEPGQQTAQARVMTQCVCRAPCAGTAGEHVRGQVESAQGVHPLSQRCLRVTREATPKSNSDTLCHGLGRSPCFCTAFCADLTDAMPSSDRFSLYESRRQSRKRVMKLGAAVWAQTLS